MIVFPCSPPKYIKCAAYTLIELSITLALIGVIFGSALSISAGSKEKEARQLTNERLDAIENALQLFLNLHERLPCPASPSLAETSSNFGIEDNCAAANPAFANIVELFNGTADQVWSGVVPVETLGLPRSYMYDAWNNRISYTVYAKFAAKGNVISTQNLTDVTRQIRVNDINNNQINPNIIGNAVAYVLVSHGKDKKGAYGISGAIGINCSNTNTHDDIENCDIRDSGSEDAIFRDIEINDSDIQGEYFYDFIRWKTKNNLGDVAIP